VVRFRILWQYCRDKPHHFKKRQQFYLDRDQAFIPSFFKKLHIGHMRSGESHETWQHRVFLSIFLYATDPKLTSDRSDRREPCTVTGAWNWSNNRATRGAFLFSRVPSSFLSFAVHQHPQAPNLLPYCAVLAGGFALANIAPVYLAKKGCYCENKQCTRPQLLA